MRLAVLLVLVWLLVLPVPGVLGAQEIPRPLTGGLSPSPVERAPSPGSCAKLRLLPCDDERADSWTPQVTVAAADDAQHDERRRSLLTALLVAADLAVTGAKATLTYDHTPFQVDHEGYFGANTALGGADKASHFVDYYIISKEFTGLFKTLGYSENASRWIAFGTAVAGAGERGGRRVHEVRLLARGHRDGRPRCRHRGPGRGDAHGRLRGVPHFPSRSLRARCLLNGFEARGPGQPARARYWAVAVLVLLDDVWGQGLSKWNLAEKERQVGLEIGLNLEEILNATGVRRDTWWGVALHVVVDNVRFPYTAVGFRYDLNHSKWYGPNTGNYP